MCYLGRLVEIYYSKATRVMYTLQFHDHLQIVNSRGTLTNYINTNTIKHTQTRTLSYTRTYWYSRELSY